MQRYGRRPFGRPPLLDRLLLRRAALRYAAHGWAVTPGACLTGHRFACERPGCPIMACHPATASWADDASADPARVAYWWRRRPHTVLLATGGRFDVLEVPAAVGVRVLGTARLHAGVLGDQQPDVRGPVAVTPAGRWMFLVRPGAALRPELAGSLDVIRHGRGSWIPVAPTRTPDGPVRWAVAPQQVHWRLPDPVAVQAMLVDAIGALGRPVAPVPAVPRQLSTARRAV